MSKKDKSDKPPKKRGRIENLKPFKPGQSGNPGGRPKKRPITDRYYEMAEEQIPETLRSKMQKSLGIKLPEGSTWGRIVTLRQFLQASGLRIDSGSTRAAREIREAIEGKAPQRIEISGPERKEIRISVRFDRKKR